MKRQSCALLLKQIRTHIRGKGEKHNLTMLSNSYWSPFLLSLENTISSACVCVCASSRVCDRCIMFAFVLVHVFVCVGQNLSVCRSFARAIFWQPWHGAPLRVKADTRCYSSLVLHSVRLRSECSALFSLFCLFTSTPPYTSAHLFPAPPPSLLLSL